MAEFSFADVVFPACVTRDISFSTVPSETKQAWVDRAFAYLMSRVPNRFQRFLSGTVMEEIYFTGEYFLTSFTPSGKPQVWQNPPVASWQLWLEDTDYFTQDETNKKKMTHITSSFPSPTRVVVRYATEKGNDEAFRQTWQNRVIFEVLLHYAAEFRDIINADLDETAKRYAEEVDRWLEFLNSERGTLPGLANVNLFEPSLSDQKYGSVPIIRI
jgi:hypothetical protein